MTNGFERRFARHRDELEWLFNETLYGVSKGLKCSVPCIH